MKIFLFFTLVVFICGQLTIVCDDVLRIPNNTQYTYTLSATGGQLPNTFTSQGLPDGITLNGNTISGLSTNVGIFPVVITVQDANSNVANKHIFVYVTSPSGSTAGNTTTTTTTTTTTQSGSASAGLASSVLPLASTSQSANQSASLTVSANNLQTTGANVLGGVRIPQGSISQSPDNSNSPSSLGFPNSLAPGSGSNSFGNPQLNLNGPIQITVQPTGGLSNPNTNVPNLPLNAPNVSPASGVLIVPTTTPYITNYSFASTLQNTPTVSSQSTDTVFQRQANVNRMISNLLSQIQNYNATLLGLQANIPNTTSLLNDAIRNQRVAQAQVNSIVNQNNSLTTNITGIQSGIKTLQDQIFSTTSTINNSQAQIQSLQTRITQNYLQINDTQNKINQANSSLKAATDRQSSTASAISRSRNIILGITQNITATQNDINNSPTYLARLGQSLNNQKAVILALQKQLKEAILALVPIQTEVDYYSMIPVVGPGYIQQNKTLLLSQSSNLAQIQPVYDNAGNDIQTYTNLVKQLTTAMGSLTNQLSADQLAYDNLMGSQNNQEGLFNNTLINIAAQTQLLNKARQQQNTLITGQYNAALQVVSDTTSKVNQLTQTLDSLNRRYQSVQDELAATQRALSDALQQKDLADQAVNQAIQSGGGNLAAASASSLSSGSGNVIANITITGS